jgi:hypothetical protein
MNEHALRTEAQARRLALFLESALRGDDGWWLPRDRMVHRIRQTVAQWPLVASQEIAAWRFLREVAQAAGLRFEVSPEVWLRVADLLEVGAPSGVLDEPSCCCVCNATDQIRPYGSSHICTPCRQSITSGEGPLGLCEDCDNDATVVYHDGTGDRVAYCPLHDRLDEPATDPLPETGEPRGSTQAQAPTPMSWTEGFWTTHDDALLAEWLYEQNGETSQ